MDEISPLVVPLMFVLRCLVPLAIMLGLSYLLKRLGLIKEPPAQPPPGEIDQVAAAKNSEKTTGNGGGLLHGKL